MTEETVSLREFFVAKLEAQSLHFEARINNLERHTNEIDNQREMARKVALTELERRLQDLNHAHARAAEVLQTYLSREIFEKFREEDANWKRQDEVLRAAWVTQEEFRAYKETTSQALTLTAGKSQGIGSVWGAVVIVFSIMAAMGTIATAIFTFLH